MIQAALSHLLILLAASSQYNLVPDASAVVSIVFDMSADNDLLYWATNATAKQLPVLTSVYEEAGYELKVRFYAMQYMLCGNGWGLTSDQNSYLSNLDDLVAKIGNVEQRDTRYIQNTIGDEANELKSYSGRKVEVFITDAVQDFGTSEKPVGCNATPYSASYLASRLKEANVGLLYSAFGKTLADASSIQKKANTLYTDAGIEDLFVDGNPLTGDSYGFDSIEYHLAKMLSPEFIAEHAPTTKPPTMAETINRCIQEALQCA